MSTSNSQETYALFRYFFPALIIFSLYLAYTLASPFIHAIIMGIVFAGLSWPLQKRLLRLMKGRRIPATICTMLLIITCLILPICTFIIIVIPEAIKALGTISDSISNFNLEKTVDSKLVTNIFDFFKENVDFINPETEDISAAIIYYTQNASQLLLKGATKAVSNAVTFAFHCGLVLLVMFFMLLDAEKMLNRFMYLFPLKEVQKDTIVERLSTVAKAVLVGGLLVAVLQGLAGGVAMAIVGMPALFCGTLMALASFVPVFGTGLVWVPVTIWLFLHGNTWEGVFVLIWCGGLVTAIDSIMRPLFMSNTAGLSTFFLFMSIIGGLKAYGMLGIFYGPLILGFVVVMLSLYAHEYKDFLIHRWPAIIKKTPKEKGSAASKTKKKTSTAS